jgi:hypothetical protein
LIPLCFSIAFAQEDPPPVPPAPAPGQNMVDKASAFVDTYLKDVPGFDKTAYMKEIEDMAFSKEFEDNLNHFNVDKYIDGVEGKVKDMLDSFKTFKEIGQNQNDYLKQAAEFFIKEYCKDIKNGVLDISTNDYINDLGNLNNNFVSKLETLNAPPTDPSEKSKISFNPEDFLDKATGNTQKSAKIEFYWGGVGDHWLNNNNLMSIIDAFQKNFFHDSVAQTDFAYLKDLWPPSAEVYAMNAAYDPKVYEKGEGSKYDKQHGKYASSYMIDEYGLPADADKYKEITKNDKDNGSVTVTDTTEYFNDGGYSTYNNRRWGYNYSNTTNVTIKITTNGRTYNLQESVFTSPLILDLDNDGAIGASKGVWLPHPYRGAKLVEFDMDGDGFVDLTEWVGPNDGILFVNPGTTEVDANAFFGWAGGFAHGYEKLSLLDENGDRAISGDELKTLSVWQDSNGNAQIDEGEAKTLAEMGITSISLNFDNDLVSYYEQNGERIMMVDWHPSVFVVRKTR